ncbi:MAG: hypothetical protein SGILL_009342 [Bacillariaceae sp.]
MAVDEFGREIPAARGGGGRRSPSPTSHHYDGAGGPEAPSLLYEALSSSRYEDERRSERRPRDRDRGSGHHKNDDRPIGRKRKHRSESPPPSRRNDSRDKDRRNEGGSSSSKQPAKPHPSTVYAEEPMMCQYLWKEANEGKTDEDYEEYRKTYCLNYVRMFFNEHMDDSWFRSMYSPLARYRVAAQERKRATGEAKAFLEEMESSISKQVATGGSGSDPSFFVLKARLGNGIRETGPDSYRSSPQKSSQQSLVNPIPATHVMAITSQVLPIQEVPAHVTDEQLTTALLKYTSSKEAAASVILYSGVPAADLTRTAYLQAPEDVRKEIIQKLNNLDRGGPANASKDGSHVPRKEDTYIPKTLEMVVECSDAYGRSEVDADGKGGEPDEQGGVPSRKASVWISTRPINPHVQVLSAALSSKLRIEQDQQSAYKLAKAYDARRGVPAESRLETILSKAVPGIAKVGNAEDPPSPQEIEDSLDLTIAYLRRVHLFSFYNACTVAHRVAEVLDGKHAASTIHLRLANADEILEPKEGEAPVVDLLVQRLDNAIQESLDDSRDWEQGPTDQVVDTEVDTQAKEIEKQESTVEEPWIQDHSMIDQDGRARCSFHFCKKLFKDSKFLRKHLIKKHSDFLRAEIAKCHDNYMMKAWDSQECRPVPPILVECGHRFGLKPSPVLGAADPLAADPEPELWRREEERREMEEQEAEARRERYERRRQQEEYNDVAPSLDAPLSEGRETRKRAAFVDVDDMQEEKVEMAFDSVEIPVQPPKKKKKKKKLL